MINLRIELLSEDSFNIYLNKFYFKELELTNKLDLELYFKSLFLKLKKKYNMKMECFYIIDVYKDKYYEMVLKIKKEDFSYFDDNTVDMRIRIKDKTFYYQLLDIDNLKLFNSFGYIYQNKDKLYLKINKNLNYYYLGLLEENSKIIFDNINEEKLKLVNVI